MLPGFSKSDLACFSLVIAAFMSVSGSVILRDGSVEPMLETFFGEYDGGRFVGETAVVDMYEFWRDFVLVGEDDKPGWSSR